MYITNNTFKNNRNMLEFLKKGSGIHIKEKNKGSFTKWCGGEVTNECIRRGKNSSNPKIRKKATFADNARYFKHFSGGNLIKKGRLGFPKGFSGDDVPNGLPGGLPGESAYATQWRRNHADNKKPKLAVQLAGSHYYVVPEFQDWAREQWQNQEYNRPDYGEPRSRLAIEGGDALKVGDRNFGVYVTPKKKGIYEEYDYDDSLRRPEDMIRQEYYKSL